MLISSVYPEPEKGYNYPMNNKQGVCTNALIQNKNNEVLVVKRSSDDDVFPNEWELPGGKVEYKETPEESLIREIKEECDLSINVIRPLTVKIFFIDDIQYFEITYHCKLKNENYEIKLSHEHSEYKWISLENIESAGLNTYIASSITRSIASILL